MKAKDTLVVLLAQGMGIGRVPFAPGTLGTLLGLPLVWWLWQADGLTYVVVLTAVILIAVGSAIVPARFLASTMTQASSSTKSQGSCWRLLWCRLHFQP